MFIAHIGEELARKLGEKLSTAYFFSVRTDDFEDASLTEKEAIFVQYLETNPPGRDTVQVVIAFVRLAINY